MLEAYAHNHLKTLFQKDAFSWPHNLTLSRLVSRSLRRHDRSFVQLEVGDLEKSWLGILVPLCLQSNGVVLIITERQRSRLINYELPRLKLEGLTLAFWEGDLPPSGEQTWLLDHLGLLKAYKDGYLESKQLIIPEMDFLSSRLREAMAIKISPNHWDLLCRAYPSASSALIQLHERLTRKLFSHVTTIDGTVRMDFSEIIALRDLLTIYSDLPQPWSNFQETNSQNWASWAVLDHKSLEWCWYLKPLEPLQDLQEFFQETSFVMLSGSTQNNFLLSQLESSLSPFDVNVKLGGSIPEWQDPIQMFVPRRQPLPNTEYFAEHLLVQCRRLVLGRKGLTIIVVDDNHLLKQLTSELAAEFGKRVVFESTSPASNGVICCHSSWWLYSQDQLPLPEQLIFGVLPFPSLEVPLIAARVEAYKSQGRDWFRNLLLPELLQLLPRLILPIRKSQGRLAILDGRLRSRSWGERIFKALEPWTALDRLLPD